MQKRKIEYLVCKCGRVSACQKDFGRTAWATVRAQNDWGGGSICAPCPLAKNGGQWQWRRSEHMVEYREPDPDIERMVRAGLTDWIAVREQLLLCR